MLHDLMYQPLRLMMFRLCPASVPSRIPSKHSPRASVIVVSILKENEKELWRE